MVLFNNQNLFESLRNAFSDLKSVVITIVITLTLLWVINKKTRFVQQFPFYAKRGTKRLIAQCP